ncbi:MAG: hypothetical protein E7Z99_08345 [Coriobacteriaceae bacterium]|nr:hypothetical protein [Coriobacteriaceae bacterium]
MAEELSDIGQQTRIKLAFPLNRPVLAMEATAFPANDQPILAISDARTTPVARVRMKEIGRHV